MPCFQNINLISRNVASRLLNSLLFGIPQCQFRRLQRVLNAAARMICFTPRSAHITPVLMYLHWLPIKFRVDFKIALLVYKALNGMAGTSVYSRYTLSFKLEGSHHLRSDDRFLFQIPRTNAKTLGDKAFKHAAPTIWNSLPIYIRQCETVYCFKTELKTFLFRKAFNYSSAQSYFF